MTINFDHFKALNIKEKTADFYINGLSGDTIPVLVLRPGTVENAAYFNEMLKRYSAPDLQALSRRKGAFAADGVARALSISTARELIPLYLLVDWRNIFDSAKNPVPYSAEAAQELVAALPDYLIEEIVLFVNERSNFSDTAHAYSNGEDYAKNSVSA